MAFRGAGSAQEFGSDDIHIVKVIGTGSFGKVMQGKLLDTTDVAVKCVKVRHERSGRDRSRTDMEFEAEASTLFRLCHSRIVRLYGICKIDDYYCLVMEFCPYSLFRVLNTTKAHKKELPVGLQWRFVRETAEAVLFLHKQPPKKLLHLDLKSGNILLTEDLRIKLCDFGLSVWSKYSTNQTVDSEDTVSTRGTRTHMAPEMLTNVHLLPTVKCDVYSFSIVMWEVLTCCTDPYPNARFKEQIMYSVGRDNFRPTYNFSFDQSVSRAENISVAQDSGPEELVSAMAQLMKICWDPDYLSRPNFSVICDCLDRMGQKPFCSNAAMRKDAAGFHLLLEECLRERSGSTDTLDDMFATDTVASGALGDILDRVMTIIPKRPVPEQAASPGIPGPPGFFDQSFRQPFFPPTPSPPSPNVDIGWFVEANKTPLTPDDMDAVAKTFVDHLNRSILINALELGEGDVHEISQDYQSGGSVGVARALLNRWRTQRGGYATKGMLYSVLKDKNLGHAAHALTL